MSLEKHAKISAGIPASNNTLYWRIGFLVGDPVALVEMSDSNGERSVLILRDIEMDRAKQSARVDEVRCPADFQPDGGLSGDRETATAQAAAEYLRREGVTHVTADRSLPLIYAEFLSRAGIDVECDPERWILERRQKNAEEIEHIREAQRVTELAMRFACELVANADANQDGVLYHEQAPLTSEIVRAKITHFLIDQDYSVSSPIVAGGPVGADCHDIGSGMLRTEQPVIIDIFPRNKQTLYCGDCTRTVVHGAISDEIKTMHRTVQLAKAAGEAAVAPGVTGEAVHQATIKVIQEHGFGTELPDENSPADYCAMPHGTGHGIGLDVHESPLLHWNAPELMVGDAVTIEPGLYQNGLGGIRIEDIVVVTEDGCLNLNSLSEELTWA